ncbi:MAG: hypothetical protein ACFB3T_05970 [Geminicoccaceae bacterium]
MAGIWVWMRRSALAALAGLTAACEEATIHDSPIRYKPNVWSFVTWARGEGPILAEVYGEAFGLGPEREHAHVLDLIRDRPAGTAITWTGDPARAGQTRYRLRILLNGPKNATGKGLCAGQWTSAGPQDNNAVEMLITFCDERAPMIEIAGRVGRLDGIDDPDFASLIRTGLRLIIRPNS